MREVLTGVGKFIDGIRQRYERDQELLRGRTLEALAVLMERGATEATGYSIIKTIEELHPPKRFWDGVGFSSMHRALSALEGQGVISSRKEIAYNEHGKPFNRFFYHRVAGNPQSTEP